MRFRATAGASFWLGRVKYRHVQVYRPAGADSSLLFLRVTYPGAEYESVSKDERLEERAAPDVGLYAVRPKAAPPSSNWALQGGWIPDFPELKSTWSRFPRADIESSDPSDRNRHFAQGAKFAKRPFLTPPRKVAVHDEPNLHIEATFDSTEIVTILRRLDRKGSPVRLEFRFDPSEPALNPRVEAVQGKERIRLHNLTWSPVPPIP